jgi:hypothetical protein
VLYGGWGGARFPFGTCNYRLHCWSLGLVGVPLWVRDRGSTSSSLLAFCVLAWGGVVVVARFLSPLSCVWSAGRTRAARRTAAPPNNNFSLLIAQDKARDHKIVV